jgi:ABC-2 type transport system permease protein
VKKGKFISSLKSRQFRYGGYATLIALVVLAVLVAVNILVGQIPGKLDLTQNKLYSLSDETFKLLDGLKTDVTITTVSKPGSEDPTVAAILAKYAAHSRHIKLETKDPELNPGWTKQYDTTGQGLMAGTLVVVAGTKYKNIGYYDMYNYDTSNYDPTNANSQPTLTSMSVEQRVTSAVQFVTAEKNTTLYVLAGHGEQTLDSFSLTAAANNENYAIQSLTLLSAPTMPTDADILLILAPKSDLPIGDANKVREIGRAHV